MEENVLDVEEMAQWISEMSGIEYENVMAVLDLETAFMEKKGFIDEIDDDEFCEDE